jgi:hypothetical protein
MGPLTAPRDSAPRITTTATPWPDDDVSHVAFRLKALGGDESDVHALLAYWALSGVRRVRAYVNATPDVDLEAQLAAASAQVGARNRRGDLIRIRAPKRWPWRTSTSQPMGGAVG